MARVRWHGDTFNAQPVRALADGSWEMIALGHTARTVPGTTIIVQKDEIVEMAAAEMPGTDVSPSAQPPDSSVSAGGEGPVQVSRTGLTALNAAMAEERKTLTPVQELIAAARKAGTLPNPKPKEV